jgi:hypothetical protein
MDTIEAIHGRRSVRDYQDRPVEGSPMAWLGSEEGAAAVGIPDGFEAVAPILVGYPTSAPPPRRNARPEIVWAADLRTG